MQAYKLTGGSPWGFRLVGGQDFRMDLSISKVTPGGKADRAGIKPGMILTEINGQSTKGLSHLEAQNAVKSATTALNLILSEPNQKKTDATGTAKPPSTYQAQAPSYSSPTSNYTPPQSYQKRTDERPAVSSTPSSYQKPSSKPTSNYAPTPSYQKPSNNQTRSSDFVPSRIAQEEKLPPPPPSMLAPELKQSSGQADPLCEGCGKPIVGPYLSHKGKNWHVDEFVCTAGNCRKPLQNVGFIEENGQRYCKDCYEKHFAHSCGKCHKKIVGEVMHALNQTWHMACFVCVKCNGTFKDGVFQMHNNEPYCIEDYNHYFREVCKGCNFPIDAGDRYLEALSAQWHETCFQCAVCHCDLKNAGFFASGGKPVCSNHKNARVM